MNKSVTATGMQVKATSASSLIIGTTAADLSNRRVTVGITAQSSAIAPSTLNWTSYTSSGLGYVTNPTDVDPATGLAKDQENHPLVLADVSTDESGVVYYIDYDMYIAASGAPMTAALAVSLGDITTVTGLLDQAFTVAFYVGSVSAGNLKGSLRFNQTAITDTVTLVTKATDSIPEAATSNIHIIARVFLDGAYQATAGTANVNNGTVDTDAITFGLNFVADES